MKKNSTRTVFQTLRCAFGALAFAKPFMIVNSIIVFFAFFITTGCMRGTKHFHLTYNVEGMEKMSPEDSLRCEISVNRKSYVVMHVEGLRHNKLEPSRWYSYLVLDNRGEIVAKDRVEYPFHDKSFWILPGEYKFTFQFSEDLLNYIKTEKKKLLIAPQGDHFIRDGRIEVLMSLWEFDLKGEIISTQPSVPISTQTTTQNN